MKSFTFKYVIIDNGEQELPIIFSKFFQHLTIANKFGHIKIVSAGFVKFEDEDADYPTKFNCYGESESLKIKSRGSTDEQLLKNDYETKG